MSIKRLFVLGWLMIGVATAVAAVGIAVTADPAQAQGRKGGNSDG